MTVRTRSGGDSLKKQELRSPPPPPPPPLQALDEKSTKSQQFWNAKSEAMPNKIDRHDIGDTCWIENLKECPVFYPTREDFEEDPLRYIQRIAVEASKYGICKIVSPVVASVPAGVVLSKEQSSFRFTTRLQPMRVSNWDKGDKVAFPFKGRHYTLKEYEKVANRVFSRKFSTAAGLPPRFIESVFWKELVDGKTRTVEYATDVDGSAFSTSKSDPLGQSKWNLKRISRLPDSTLRLLEEDIPGVTEPMLYIGMLFSMFAWHVEDHYLYSINYQHCGAPKTWYGVPGDAALHFEKVVKGHVYSTELLNDTGKGAELDLLLEKTTMFAPKLLTDHGVPVFKAVQYPGEFIVTFPRAYHAGFSHGFNCGEAVNFAMADWFIFGAEACLRYRFLNRLPILRHDELLCKEATLVHHKGHQSGHTDSLCKQQACIMMAFVALMQSHQQVKSALERQGAKTITTSSMIDVLCGLCKHKCYVGYIHCKCFPEPTCFNHGDFLSSCSCKGDRTLFLRRDFTNLRLAAQKYEQEEEVRKQSQRLFLDSDTVEQGDGSSSRGADECFESLLTTNTMTSKEACDKQADREDACSANVCLNLETSGVIATPNCRQAQKDQDEEESDSEVLKIKRRRLASSQIKRFQVDEQEIEKTVVRSLGFEIAPASGCEGLDTQGFTTSGPVMNGDLISVCHVINELNIKGSAAEVMSQWQINARRQGLILKIKEVTVGQENLKVLSFKSLSRLKHLVSREEAKILQRLMWKVKSKRNGYGHLDKWSTGNEIQNSQYMSESSNERRDSSCGIPIIGQTQLTVTTELCVEMHSDSDKRPSAESKNIEALSTIASSTMLHAETTSQKEVQNVTVSRVSGEDDDTPEFKGSLDTSYQDSRIKSVLYDPELIRVEDGNVREEECSSSELGSMETEAGASLIELVAEAPVTELGAERPNAAINMEERESSNLERIVSSPAAAAELETCMSVMSHIENAEIGTRVQQGRGLASDEGRLCHMEEVCIHQCDESSQALGTENTLTDTPAEPQLLADPPEGIRERDNETDPTANTGESFDSPDKPEIIGTSSSVPKRGLVIFLNRQKIEHSQAKAAQFSHNQNKSENDYEQVDIFEGQASGETWCLDEGMPSFCLDQNEGGSVPSLEQQLTSWSGENSLHHDLECKDAPEGFAESFNPKADGPSKGGELSVVGHQHGKSVLSQVDRESPIAVLGHDVYSILEPNIGSMGSRQVFAEEYPKEGNLESINLLSHIEYVLPADRGKQQKFEMSCKAPGLDVQASRFKNSSHCRETPLRYDDVDKPSFNAPSYGGFKTYPYHVNGGMHWDSSQQRYYNNTPHHPTGQRASRNDGGKYKYSMRRSLPYLHQEHHPYHRGPYRSSNHPHVYKQQVPCRYWKRRMNRHDNGSCRDARSMNAFGGHCSRIKDEVDKQITGCSSSTFEGTGSVEGYDPLKWEISPTANSWHFYSSNHHARSSLHADSRLPGGGGL